MLGLSARGVDSDPVSTCGIGQIYNHRVIAVNGRQWWAKAGLPVVPLGLELVGQDRDRRAGRQVWLAEGESDCLTLRGEIAEWRGLPVDVLGLPGAATWKREWAAYLKGYAAVYLFPDGDRAGARLAQRLSVDVPHVIRVQLPDGCDVRSVVQKVASSCWST